MLVAAFVLLAAGAAAESPIDPLDPRSLLRLQVLLDRVHCSPGEIDGKPGSNTARALAAFQKRTGLVPVDPADESTWVALEDATGSAVPLVAYTITKDDVAGPYNPPPADMMDKAQREALGYGSVVEAIGERFHASPELLFALNPGVSIDTEGQVIQVPNVRTEVRDVPVDRVVVDAATLSVQAIGPDGQLVAYYPASMGSEHDPLPDGRFTIAGVAQEPPYSYDPSLFWDAKEGHSKAMLPPGPNNPVGVVWIALSQPNVGIHGTPEPSKIGKTESHGCIRLTNWDAEELSHLVRPGTPAFLRNGATRGR